MHIRSRLWKSTVHNFEHSRVILKITLNKKKKRYKLCKLNIYQKKKKSEKANPILRSKIF